MDQPRKTAFRTQQDVLDDLVGRGYLSIAVMPRELHEFEEIKSGLDVPVGEQFPNARPP